MEDNQTPPAPSSSLPLPVEWAQAHFGVPAIVTLVILALALIAGTLGALALIGKARRAWRSRQGRLRAESMYEDSAPDVFDPALREQAVFDAERNNLTRFRADWKQMSEAMRTHFRTLPPYATPYTSKFGEWNSDSLRRTFLSAYRNPLRVLLTSHLYPVLRSAGLVFADGDEDVYPVLHTVTVGKTGMEAVFISDAELSPRHWSGALPVLRRALDAPDLTVEHDPENTLRVTLLLNDQERRSDQLSAYSE